MIIVRDEKERRYAKLNTLLKEFECLETKLNARILNSENTVKTGQAKSL